MKPRKATEREAKAARRVATGAELNEQGDSSADNTHTECSQPNAKGSAVGSNRAFITSPRERARKRVKPMITAFDCTVYSEEVYPVTETEYDEVMAMIAAEDSSTELESENFVVTADGKVKHKPEPPSRGRIGGFEL